MPAVVNSPVSTAGKLNSFEKALIRAVEAGQNYWPSPKDLRPGKVIRGELIRAMLLRSPPSDQPGAGSLARRVRLTAHGIRIAPLAPRAQVAAGTTPAPLLHVVGQLDLRGVAASDGGFLPPLEFSQCLFERPIELDGAHLRSLALRACRFSRLSAKVARFSGNVVLSECGPRSDPRHVGERNFACHDLAVTEADPARPDHDSYAWMRPAWRKSPERSQPCPCPLCASPATGEADNCNLCCILDLNSAHIEGGLEISRSYWRAPNVIGRHYGAPPVRDEVAIELRGVQVRDTIKIIQSATIGRVSVVSAEVGDDFWVWGGKFFASADRPTFDFQLATIGGLLAFRAQRADAEDKPLAIRAYPVVVIGHISAIGLRAGEVWISEGFYFGHDKDKRESFPTLNFAKSDIRGTFKLGAYHDYQVLDPARPTAAANVHGDICVVAANIGKNFELLGVRHEGIREILGAHDGFFDYFGVDREETSYLKLTAQGLKVDRRAYIAHASFRDADVPPMSGPSSRPKNSAPAAVDFWKSTIGTGFRIDHHSRLTGALRLNSCVIGREAVIGCETIEPSDADFAATDFKLGDIPLLLDVSETTVKGHLKIGRREPQKERVPPEPEVAISLCGGMSLESASVQGSVLLAHVEVNLSSIPNVPEESNDPNGASGKNGGEQRAVGSAAARRHDPNRVALNLRDCTCGSDLEVHAMRWVLPAPTEGEKPPARRWRLPHRAFRSVNEPWFAIIDLRGLQCDLLVDGFGAQWGLIYRLQLRLAGIRIGDVEPPSHKADHRPTLEPAETRLTWLTFQHLRQEAEDLRETPREPTARSLGPSQGLLERITKRPAAFWGRFCRRLYCSRDEDFLPQAYNTFAFAYRKAGEDSVAEAMLVEKKNVQNVVRFRRLAHRWYWPPGFALVKAVLILAVALLIWTAVTETGFVPDDPRDRWFARRGIFGAAALFAAWPFCVGIFQLMFRWGFRYGLSPGAALASFVVLIAAGWAGVHVARNGELDAVTKWASMISKDGRLDERIALVLDVEYEPTLPPPKETPPPPPPPQPPPPDPCVGSDRAGPDAPPQEVAPVSAAARTGGAEHVTKKRPRDEILEGQAIRAQPTPCNRNVSSLLYALDVFIPLIDLDQERRCSVREGDSSTGRDPYFGWRLVKALYELLGWIVTSLVILTFTGVLRRDLER